MPGDGADNLAGFDVDQVHLAAVDFAALADGEQLAVGREGRRHETVADQFLHFSP